MSSFSIGHIKSLFSLKPATKNADKRVFTGYKSYSEFIESVNEDIDTVIEQLESGRSFAQERSEDELNFFICSVLTGMGYEANHGVFSAGASDVHVKDRGYTWIGEGKKFKGGYTNLYEGFLQLTTRYTTGGTNDNVGGVIIYFFNEKVKVKMATWKLKLQEQQKGNSEVDDISDISDDPKNTLAFLSKHPHQNSGDDFLTRHIPVLLSDNPKDKSARESDKYSAKRNE